jgi:hypothetical protein
MAMDLSLRNKLIGGLLGAAAIGGLVAVGAFLVPAVSSLASEPAAAPLLHAVALPAPGAALSTDLAKFDGRYYAIGTEPGVSLEPESATTIRKIGYGETTFVNIVTTASGTYSTDAMLSPNVRYPGIFVEPLHLRFLPFSGAVYGWSRLTGWTQIPLLDAHSVGFLDADTVPASINGVCVADTEDGGCR